MKHTLLALVATGAATVLASSVAVADGVRYATHAVAVNYADLDLASPSGVDALYARLRSAARDACGSADTRDIRRTRAQRACYDKALADAVVGVDHAALTAKHLGSFDARYARVERAARGS